ncbi:MAG: InlB B-repeat-containing protein, partial [Oscillospiraceae bacterium]
MYFFRVELSSFDDEKKVIFLIPDQTDTDENGAPFQEKLLTNSPKYKEFVKETKTSVVDVSYTVYETSAPITGEITDEYFSQLEQDGALIAHDSNEFSITTGKTSKSGGKSNLKMYAIFGVIAAVFIGLIIASTAAGNGGNTVSETAEATSEVTQESSTAESLEPTKPTTEVIIEPTAESLPETSENSGFVDTPPEQTTEEETAPADTSEPVEAVSSSGGAASSEKSEYTISFHANGGEGTLDSISSEPGQYVVLPSAESAGKILSKQGYKLIGFSDNVEINYPLYDYKMPSRDITLYAVWEPETYTVTYNSNGGTGTLSRTEVKYGDDVPLPTDVSIYNDELILAGWNSSSKAKSALKSLTMPAEDITLYAVWSDKKPTATVTLHYDDNIMVMEKEIGTTLNMLNDFGVTKEDYIVAGWYFDGSPKRIEYLSVDGDCDVYAKWKSATY